MHVQIAYSGPPQDFGWLLPAAPDVVTEVGTEELFRQLDQQFGPRFQLRAEFSERCEMSLARSGGGDVASADGGNEAAPEDPGVQILSREAVGPYDRTIIQAEDVESLREWLDENEYQIPAATDSVLQRTVAVKVIDESLQADPRFIEQFRREAQSMHNVGMARNK